MRKRRYTYPDDWEQIAREIKERAGWKCQKCGAPHGVLINRRIDDPYIWQEWREGTMGKEAEFIWRAPVKVVVSVHHIGVPKPDGSPGDSLDKSDNRPENLIALCARCHLIADLEVSKKHAKETKNENKHKQIQSSGQLELWS
jgi:hypothetical protein